MPQQFQTASIGDVVRVVDESGRWIEGHPMGTVVKVESFGRGNTYHDVVVQVLWSDQRVEWVPFQILEVVSEAS